MAIQQNNGGPVGYGQPRRGDGMRKRLMRPEDEAMFGQQSPEVEDARQDPTVGQGQPPNVYPQQPPGVPQGWQNQSMPGRTPMGAGQQRNGGFNPYGGQQGQPQQSAQQTQEMMGGARWATDDELRSVGLDPANYARKGHAWMPDYAGGSAPQTQPQGFAKTVTQVMGNSPWQQRNGGFNPSQGGYGQTGGPGVAPDQSLQQQGQYGGLQGATQQSLAGFTDIAGMRDVFKPGQFMGQLEGFNTNSWGTGERGSDTLKNMFGTIASNHDVSQPGALGRALPDIQKALPNASIVQHANEDLLDPDGPNGPLQPVDVIRGATAGGGGAAWQWGPLDQQGQGASMGGPQGPSSQIYNQAMTQLTPQAGQVGPDGAPEVQDPNSAMKFLEWLMQQQQQGQLGQAPSMPFV